MVPPEYYMMTACFGFHANFEESASIWTCVCDSNGFPQVAADGHNSNCFNA